MNWFCFNNEIILSIKFRLQYSKTFNKKIIENFTRMKLVDNINNPNIYFVAFYAGIENWSPKRIFVSLRIYLCNNYINY